MNPAHIMTITITVMNTSIKQNTRMRMVKNVQVTMHQNLKHQKQNMFTLMERSVQVTMPQKSKTITVIAMKSISMITATTISTIPTFWNWQVTTLKDKSWKRNTSTIMLTKEAWVKNAKVGSTVCRAHKEKQTSTLTPQ